jgi:hypothetical protein
VDAGRLTSDLDLGDGELVSLLDLTGDLKAHPARYADALRGRILSLLFEKPSLRTRLTFEVAAKQLGGDSILSVGPVGDRSRSGRGAQSGSVDELHRCRTFPRRPLKNWPAGRAFRSSTR